MKIEDLNDITKEASKIKNEANSQVANYPLYLEAKKLYDNAYQKCIVSREIIRIQKDFLCTIYRYESLDCEWSYELKMKDFEKCIKICIEQVLIIDNLFKIYNFDTITDELARDIYTRLIDCKITAETNRYFPIGKIYFENKDYKSALFYFRRTEEMFQTRDKSKLEGDFLKNYYLNFFILKFNISQSQAGILQSDIREKEFLERQTIKELLKSLEYANEIFNISNDKFYLSGIEGLNKVIKDILVSSNNTWQILFEYTHSDHLLNLMEQIDFQKYKSINRKEIENSIKKADYILFYTHGFNTRGKWKDDFTEIMSYRNKDENFHFILLPWDYGTFIFKFFIQYSRKKAVRKFVERYREILDTYGNCERKCIVAHSFGTYITGTAIQQNENFICDRILLAGNILDINYDWDKLKNRKQIGEVLIEQSTNDVPVLLAKILRKVFFQKWIGYAGRNGFSKSYNYLNVIKSKSGHSGMLNKDKMKNEWYNFLSN